MFANPFSFHGRIRRLEYGLTTLFLFGITLLEFIFVEELAEWSIVIYILDIFLLWLNLAQGSKRCHDLGNSGYFQFIPFYIFLLLFQDGEIRTNRFGRNPKDPRQSAIGEAPQLPKFPCGSTLVSLSTPVLLNLAAAALIVEFIPLGQYELLGVLFLSVIPFYFLALCWNHKGPTLSLVQPHMLKERVLYSVLYYVGIRLYTLYFKGYWNETDFLHLELIAIALLMGITYVPYLFYKLLFRKPALSL